MLIPTVAVLGCGARKLHTPTTATVLPDGSTYQHYARHPLRDLYTGSLFTAARRDVERRELEWFVLSALLGLRHHSYESAPYELTIRCPTWDDSTRRAWGEHAARCLAADLAAGGMELRSTMVELHMGADYARWIRPHLPHHCMPVTGQLGHRLRAYKMRRLGSEETGQIRPF